MYLSYKKIHELFLQGKTIKVNTPNGLKKILDVHTKDGPGYILKYNDGTETKAYEFHLIHSGTNFKPVIELQVGDWVNGGDYCPIKTIIEKIPVPAQTWYDFTVDDYDESYIQNDILHHNSGKSLIMYIICQYLERRMDFKNILIVVPTVSLVTQLKSDFTEYAVNDESFNPDNILLIPNTRNTKWDPNKNITITTWQSMMSILKGENTNEFFSKYEALLVDEVHTMAANVAKEIALACTSTPVKIGMTGTLSNTKSGELAIKGLFGAPYQTTTTADLIEEGTLSDVKIKSIQITHAGFDTKMSYHTENEYVRNSEIRNQFICKLAYKVSQTGNTLILYQNLDQGNYIYDWLVENTENRTVFMINGSTKADAREHSRKFTDANDNVIMVASYQLMSTGVNIKNLHNLIFASPTKSMIRLLQSVGRTLRKHHSKEQAVIYDIYDAISYPRKSDKSFGISHFAERYKIYNQAKLSVDIVAGPTITVADLE